MIWNAKEENHLLVKVSLSKIFGRKIQPSSDHCARTVNTNTSDVSVPNTKLYHCCFYTYFHILHFTFDCFFVVTFYTYFHILHFTLVASLLLHFIRIFIYCTSLLIVSLLLYFIRIFTSCTSLLIASLLLHFTPTRNF